MKKLGLKEALYLREKIRTKKGSQNELQEQWAWARAACEIKHRRPTHFIKNTQGLFVPDLRSYVKVDDDEIVYNVITYVGTVFLHTQGYATSGIGANGCNYTALSNDPVTETPASTTLSNEITTNGLGRAQNTVTLPTGSGTQTVLDHTFTASGTQSCQKAALFTASSSGVMNHVLGFTQRNLVLNDTLEVTYTITLAG